MGVKQLCKFLKKINNGAVDDWRSAHEYKDTTIAIDASPCMYQCMTAMGDTPNGVAPGSEGDTSHILGVLRRTIRLLEIGMKPVFVFDGEPPDLKKNTALKQRANLRAKSLEQLEEAQKAGDIDAVRRYSARLVKTTQRHNDEVRELLRLIGVPAIQAPGEAEALCAALASSGRADMVATEDMDALVCGAPILLRNIHKAAAMPQVHQVQEIRLDRLLTDLAFSRHEFVDLCILAGCDYLGTIARVGISTAHQLLVKHRSIEKVLENLDRSKFAVPEDWDFQAARRCFMSPDVGDVAELNLEAGVPNIDGLRNLAVHRHALSCDIVDECIRRLIIAKGCPDNRPQQMVQMLKPEAQACTTEAVATQSYHVSNHADRRVVATPVRSRTKNLQSNVAQPALPKGQETLKSFFKRKAHEIASIQDETPEKKRRRTAIQVIEAQLGAGVVAFPGEAALEDLEKLAEDLTVACDAGNREVVERGTARGLAEGEICLLED